MERGDHMEQVIIKSGFSFKLSYASLVFFKDKSFCILVIDPE